MSSYTLSEEIKFIRSYYDLLCNDPFRLNSLYSEDYKCLVSKENNDFKHSSIKMGIPRPVSKVLISNTSHLEIGDLKMINIIGQFVYGDKTQQRVCHQMGLRNNYIYSEIITILDEEIIYDKNDTKVCFSSNKKLHEIVKDISKYCNVESVEKIGDKVIMKVDKMDEEKKEKIEEEGYKFERIN